MQDKDRLIDQLQSQINATASVTDNFVRQSQLVQAKEEIIMDLNDQLAKAMANVARLENQNGL